MEEVENTPEGIELDEELTRMLEIMYEDKLWMPRDIDVAKDALWAAFKMFLDKHTATSYNGTQ